MIIWQKLLIPIPISLLLTIILWLTTPWITTLSFLLGCVIYWIGELGFILLLLRKIQKKRPKGFMRLFSLAETLKLFIFAVLFVVLVERYQLHVLPVFLGFIVNLVLYWFLFLIALGDI